MVQRVTFAAHGLPVVRSLPVLVLVVSGLVAMGMTFTSTAVAGSKITVGRASPANQQVSFDQIDHTPWDNLLRKYVDVQGRRFYLSAILNWFGEDFGKNQAAQLKSISPYLPSQAAMEAVQTNSVSVSYLDYNWSLNELKTARR